MARLLRDAYLAGWQLARVGRRRLPRRRAAHRRHWSFHSCAVGAHRQREVTVRGVRADFGKSASTPIRRRRALRGESAPRWHFYSLTYMCYHPRHISLFRFPSFHATLPPQSARSTPRCVEQRIFRHALTSARRGGCWQRFSKLALFVQLLHNVEPANELTLAIQLRVGRPV